MKIRNITIHSLYNRAMLFGAGFQMILLLLAGMVLDGGNVAQTVLISVVAFWASVAVLIARNPNNPKRFDLIYIKFGPAFVAVISHLLTMAIWQSKGLI
ncbi:hypothetical protein ACFLS1_04610 [Verrucomicrobiota bacterium]